jgi:photosystem II stability/assembly factor-like uncharacterized protein
MPRTKILCFSFLLLSSVVAFCFLSCDSVEPGGKLCTIDTLLVTLTADTVEIAPGSSGYNTVNVSLVSHNCDNEGNSLMVVEYRSPNPAGIAMIGCDFAAMTRNTGSCTFRIDVPTSTPDGTYDFDVWVEVSLRTRGNRTFRCPLAINVTSAPNFLISLSPSEISIPQGGTDQITVDVHRSGGHSDPVNLTLEGAIIGSGVHTSFFHPNPVSVSDNSSQLTLTVDQSVAPDVYQLTVKGNDGTKQKSFPLQLTVTAANSDYSISLSRSPISIEQGKSDTLTVFVNRSGGHNAPVTLSLYGEPNDVTYSFDPTAATVNEISSLLTLWVGPYASVTGGTPVRVVGNDGILEEKGAYFSLAITWYVNTWQRQSTTGFTNTLNSVHFTDVNNGVAVGEFGSIIKTANGGSTPWTPLNANTNELLTAVQFIDAMTGYVVGDNNTFLFTSNGGSSWIDTLGPTGVNTGFSGLYFLSAPKGWIVGSVICYTINGGANWDIQLPPEPGRIWQDVAFGSATHGVVVGYKQGVGRQIRYTTNGGVDWIESTYPTGNQQINSVCFVNPSTAFAVGESGTILKSTDGGANWTQLSSNTNDYLHGVSFGDVNNGWAVGSQGVYHTSDGGNTWITEYNEPGENLYDVYFVDSQTGYAVGFLGNTGIIIRRN